jgi:isopenicillin-N N-acyltransferase-like protein
MTRNRIASLTVGDDPFERGKAHGSAFAAEVAANLKTYLRRFEASGLARAEAFTEAARWREAMARQNADYSDEMHGIAVGAAQSDDAIALLNARYELAFTLFGREAQRKDHAAAEADGCSTFGVLPEASADGHTWLGQNWDWLEGVHRRTFVLRIRRSDKPSLVCLTEAGIAGGKMGVNECGIGLVENGLACDHDGRTAYQKPFHMRCREVLDADRYEDALRPIVETRRTCSANFVVGAAGGEIIDLETSPDLGSYLNAGDGVVTHYNLFMT